MEDMGSSWIVSVHCRLNLFVPLACFGTESGWLAAFKAVRDSRGLVGADFRRTGLGGSILSSKRVILCVDFARFLWAKSLS